jgi:hypothetical protein
LKNLNSWINIKNNDSSFVKSKNISETTRLNINGTGTLDLDK